MDTCLGIIGSLASVAGVVVALIVAIIQNMKYKKAKDNLNELKKIRNVQIWGSISLIFDAYKTLTETTKKIECESADYSYVSLKVISAKKNIDALCLRFLEQAILIEEDFTNLTAIKWKEKNYLIDDWMFYEAKKFIQNKKE